MRVRWFAAACAAVAVLLSGCSPVPVPAGSARPGPSAVPTGAEPAGDARWYPIRIGEYWGLVDGLGRETYPFIYDELVYRTDSDAVALGLAGDDGKIRYALGDRSGRLITNFAYDQIYLGDSGSGCVIASVGEEQVLIRLDTGGELLRALYADMVIQIVWDGQLAVIYPRGKRLALYHLRELAEGVREPSFTLEGVEYASPVGEALRLQKTDGTAVLLNRSLKMRELGIYENLYESVDGRLIIAERAGAAGSAVLDADGNLLAEMDGCVILQYVPEGNLMIAGADDGQGGWSWSLYDANGIRIGGNAYRLIYPFLDGNRYTVAETQAPEGSYLLVSRDGGERPLWDGSLRGAASGTFLQALDMLPGDRVLVQEYPSDGSDQDGLCCGLWDAAGERWLIEPGRYSQMNRVCGWNSGDDYAYFGSVQWLAGRYRPAPGLAEREDILGLDGRIVLEGVNAAFLFDGRIAWVTKGFSTGLMDTDGRWVYRASLFNTVDGDE